MMPFYVLSPCLWVEMVGPAFITSHDVKEEVLTLSSMSFCIHL